MMDLDNKNTALTEAIDILFNMKNIPQNEYDDMENIFHLFLKNFIKEDKEMNGGKNMVILTKSAQKLKDSWIKKGRVDIVSNILSNGLSFEEVSKLTGLSVEEISDIAGGK